MRRLLPLLFVPALAAATPEYQHLSSSCTSCVKIDRLLNRHSTALKPSQKVELALRIADAIKHISLKGLNGVEQRRAIYFAMNASVEVLPDDFDSETAVRLLDLRGQSPAAFDDVLWHFPIDTQKRLIERMQAFKTEKLRPNAKIPVAKELDN